MNGLGGNAFATATGTGTSGSATATATIATSNGYLVNDLNTSATAPVASTSSAEARALLSGAGFDVSAASGRQAAALGYGAPADTVSLPLVLGDSVHANFDIAGSASSHTINNSAQLSSDVFGIGVMGGSGVGKSSIAMRYVRDVFFECNESTIGAAFLTMPVSHEGREISLDIWDTAGQEQADGGVPNGTVGQAIDESWDQLVDLGERRCIRAF